MERWIRWRLVFAGAVGVFFVARHLLMTHAGLTEANVSDVLIGVVASSIASTLGRGP